jgi:hypothetical protein
VLSIFIWIVHLFGFKFIMIWEVAANTIINKQLIHTPIGYLVGFVAHFTMGAVFGVIVAYTLRFTGKYYYLLKGIGIAAVVWLVSIGFFMHLLQIQIQGRSAPLSNLMAIFEFIVEGSVTAFIVKKYAGFGVR